MGRFRSSRDCGSEAWWDVESMQEQVRAEVHSKRLGARPEMGLVEP
jgi:hypothetical protein